MNMQCSPIEISGAFEFDCFTNIHDKIIHSKKMMSTVATTEMGVVSKDERSEEKKYECQLCQKRFTRKDTLNSHMKLHSGEKKFECLTCGRKFRRKDTLTCHMRVHSNEKNFECIICHKRFNRKDILNSHMNVHSDEKNYQCFLCLRRFTRRDTLACHMNVHREKKFECVVCNKKFSRKDTLSSHMNMHDDNAKYACCVCRKRFTRNSSLVKHMRSHVKEIVKDISFQCNVCNETYMSENDLEQHVMNHSEFCNKIEVLSTEIPQHSVSHIVSPQTETGKVTTEIQPHSISHNVDLNHEMPFEVEVNPFLFMEDETEVCSYDDTQVKIEISTNKNSESFLSREPGSTAPITSTL